MMSDVGRFCISSSVDVGSDMRLYWSVMRESRLRPG
jgi:hypothetical protein